MEGGKHVMKMLIKNGLNHKELWSKAVRSQIFEDLSLSFFFIERVGLFKGMSFRNR